MIGAQIGPYRIASELGAGGMGTVYLAEDERGDNVAIKVVHPHLIATPGFFKRFLREAELGKQVRHENVVRTVDVDATMLDGAQVNFMVMEYVEGRSLRQLLLDLGTVPEALLREIALQAAAGLAAIHAQDIVHRDLKPENVLITNDQRVRIMDLGVAKLQEASVAITREGQFAGSVLYAAPEQFSDAPVGPAADLYGLGVMLHELATGTNPFRRDDAAGVIRAHLNLEPPRLTEQSPDLSPFLAEVTATLLAKEPGQRFESATVLKTLLEEGEDAAWWEEREQALRKRERILPKIRVRRETELHGRTDELEQIRQAWESAKRGCGNTLWVEGEAGIGKTRLIEDFLRSLGDEDPHVLYGAYPPSGGIGGLSDAILGKFGTSGLGEVLAPYLNETPSLIPAFSALVRRETVPTGSEPLAGDALHAVCCNLMQALAREKPTIWIVDELHFAPGESRKLLLSMARSVEGHRLLLLTAARPGLAEDELTHFSRLENFRRITVGRLSPREIIELVRDALKSEMLADRLGAQIAYKSDGVPFFAFEIIRGLKEAHFLGQRPDGTYVETRPISEIQVPSAVKDMIEARLRDLSKDERAILDVGAVLGFEFEPDLVARVRDMKRVHVLETLAEIERRSGVVRAKGRHYSFDHPQLQEVLLAGISEGLREEYHSLLAEAFGKREGIEDATDISGEEAHFLAWHGLHGSEPRAGLPYLKRALKHLESGHRTDTALELTDRALGTRRLLRGEERVDVLFEKAKHLDALGRRDEQEATLEEAVRVADDLKDTTLRSRAKSELGTLLWAVARYDQALEVIGQALALAQEAGDRIAETEATGSLGRVYWNLARWEEARESFDRTLSLACEIGDRGMEMRSRMSLGVVYYDWGQYEVSRRHFEDTLALARELGRRREEGRQLANLADVSWALGHYGKAHEHAENSLTVYREIGERSVDWDPTRVLGLAQAALGQPDLALETLTRARSLARSAGDQRGEGYVIHALGLLAEQKGDGGAAAEIYQEALALRREIKYPKGVSDSLVALGRLQAAGGLETDAVVSLREGLEIGEAIGLPSSVVLARAYLAVLRSTPPEDALEALAQHESVLGHATKMEARFAIWRATHEVSHLERAHEMLRHLIEHAPADYHESMIENVPLHRDIAAAWKEHGQ